jgi:hypothetical protein
MAQRRISPGLRGWANADNLSLAISIAGRCAPGPARRCEVNFTIERNGAMK